MTHARWMLALIASSATALQAMDAPGSPAWLHQPYLASWHLTPLADVLAAVATACGLPIAETTMARATVQSGLVVLVDAQPSTLGATVKRLERTQHIRLSIVSGSLLAETPDEYAQRLSEWRIYRLESLACIEPAQDQPAPELGLGSRRYYEGAKSTPPGNPRDFASSKEESNLDPAAYVDILEREIEEAEGPDAMPSMEQRSDNQLFIQATPDIHALIARKLKSLYALENRHRSWRAAFGILPPGLPLPTGVIDRAAAIALLSRLAGVQALMTSGFLGQTVHAAALQDRSIIDSALVINDRLAPELHELRIGRSLETRTLAGETITLLNYRLAWVDDDAPAVASVLFTPGRTAPPLSPPEHPAAPTAPAATVAPTTPVAPPATTGGDAGAAAQKTLTQVDGSRITLTLPILWSWTPTGQVFLRPGEALVLASEHSAGHAVIVVTEVP